MNAVLLHLINAVSFRTKTVLRSVERGCDQVLKPGAG
jgi:hypothetical protein